MGYAGSHRLGGRPRRSRILCCMTGGATSVRSVTEVASGNRCRGVSSGFRKTPSCAARPAGPSTSQAPAAPPRNRRREIMLKAKGHAEQERVRGVLGTLGGHEVRDGSQALVLVGPRALERELEDDERHRAIGQAERGAVHEAILLSERRELAAGEVRLLNEPVQPDLFHPGRSYELRVVELPAKDRVPQNVGKEAVPEVQSRPDRPARSRPPCSGAPCRPRAGGTSIMPARKRTQSARANCIQACSSDTSDLSLPSIDCAKPRRPPSTGWRPSTSS